MSRDQFGTSDNGRPTLVLGNKHTITVSGVNVTLLREQRDTLLELTCGEIQHSLENETREHLEGLVTLLDKMLDIAEGFEV